MLENYTDSKIREIVDSIVEEYEDNDDNWPCYIYHGDNAEALIKYIQELRDELKEVLQELPYDS